MKSLTVQTNIAMEDLHQNKLDDLIHGYLMTERYDRTGGTLGSENVVIP